MNIIHKNVSYMSFNKYFTILIIYSILVGSLFNYISMNGELSSTWLFPYFSGASNTGFFQEWKYTSVDVEKFQQASQIDKVLWNFKEYPSTELYQYNYNDIGYLYIVKMSTIVFPFLPSILATIFIQFVLHLFVSWLVLRLMISNHYSQKVIVLFILFYSGNPFIIYIVTSPFYYSWQVLPSILWIIFSENEKQSYIRFFILLFIGCISFFIRPTTIIPIATLGYIYTLNRKKLFIWIFILVMIISAFLVFPYITSKAPWHTMYIGLGAYDESPIVALGDIEGYKAFYRVTGEKVVTNIPEVSFNDPDFRNHYYRIIKNEYLRIVSQEPGLIIRNAIYNILQSYGFGYKVGSPWFIIISIFSGLIVLSLAIIQKGEAYIFALISTSLGYALYYPPIPVYNYGMYILSLFVVLKYANNLILKARKKQNLKALGSKK